MPYQSKAQQAYMHIHHPGIAARWDREYGTPKNLPDHKQKRKQKRKVRKPSRHYS